VATENLFIETECLELVYLAKAGNRDKSSLGHLVADLRDLLASPQIIEFNKIYRDQNSASYELLGLVYYRIEPVSG
jgi:hypothetical protein